jgi:hypothetical protein
VYHPFPEDSAKWCSTLCCCEGDNFWNATDQLSGKVLINGNWYSRMLHYEKYCYGSHGCYCYSINSSYIDTFYIRQDTAQKKVWLYVDSTNTDTIFLDFDLHVGDTINARKAYWARNFGQWDGPHVIAIDSVLIDTDYRTQYTYEDQGHPNYLIEGIGPDHGFFYDANVGYDYESALQEFIQNSQVFYPWYNSDTTGTWYYCHDFTTGTEELNQFSFSISPNPAHNLLNVECTIQNAELKIYDVMGREVYSTTLNAKHEILNLSLSPALYFVRVASSTSATAVQKLVVE